MKSLITSCLILLFSIQLLSQTTDEIPSPERVLVVYRANHPYSLSIANYYMEKRNIPSTNKMPITITDPGNYGCEFRWDDEEIVDLTLQGDGGWHYVKEVIADVIENYLNTTYYNGQLLKNVIRYIVLCKGIPLKVRNDINWEDEGWQSQFRNRVSVDALLCLINQPDGRSFVDLYETPFSNYTNPYFEVDPLFTMYYRFLSNHFVNQEGWYLQYLVSRLDGDNLDDVDSLINRSVNPDMSGGKYWIIDDDPAPAATSTMEEAHRILKSFNFNLNPDVYINSPEWIVNNAPTYEQVMGYVSHGRNTAIGDTSRPRMPATYILDTLNFDYSNGAIFNSWESFNGWSFGVTRADHGLISDFIHMGGTGGGGHVYEPFGAGAFQEKIVFPSYSMGYSIVDAIYQGFQYMAWQNVIVGDPLSRIYNCENTVISNNTIIGDGDYYCDVIVPVNVTLTIDDNSTVNFNRNAKLKVYGSLELEQGAVLNFNAYSMLIQGVGSDLIIPQNVAVNFNDNSSFEINDNFIFEDGSPFSFGGSCNIIINGSAELSEASTFSLVNGMSCNVNGSFILNGESTLNLLNNSSLISNGSLVVNNGSTLNVIDSSKFFSYGELIINKGVVINLQYSSPGDFILGGVIKSLGIANNPVSFNCLSESGIIKFSEVDTLLMQHSEINSGYIFFAITNGIQKPRLLSISNTVVNNSPQVNYFLVVNTEGLEITLTDNYFSTGYPNYVGCLYFFGFDVVDIVRNNIHYTTDPLWSIGITSQNNKSLNINHCYIDGYNTGIQRGYIFQDGLEDVELIYDEDLRIYNCTLNGGQSNNGAAISIGLANNYQVSGVKIDLNEISDYKTGIQINNADNFSLGITNNSITDYGLVGILVSNGSEVLVKENLISADASTSEHCVGISVNQVSNPSILGNTIDADSVSSPGSGIALVSCNNGEVRLNTIQNHLYGIELGSASPKIGANTITNNDEYGIYISDNSNPDLTGSFVGDDQFPLSGYNTIRENGLCTETRNSELYLLSSLVKLEKGCNTIADDRDGVQQQCNNLYLIDGRKIPETIIQARANYWGNHPVYGNDPTGRFGEEVTIDYSDYFSEPCTYSQGEAELILANSKGEVYDTVYSTGNTAFGLSDIESRYATANNYYYNNQYNQAKQEYEGIIQYYVNSNESIQAYNRLYTITSLTNSSPSVFDQLKDYYLQQAANQTDSLMIGTLKHLSDLCLVSAEEYLPAINNFDEIAQQNPNTDIALYRQIDALTTALLLPQDSTLNKGVLGKYSINGLSDYTNKLSELIKTRGKSGLESEKELLPTEYTLYQNYPNPFNPVTTIKYDLPYASEVSVVIYDILGRKVKELVNTKQQAGRYEILFNATGIASGVYIYQLVTEKFLRSKKMILLK